MSAGMETLDTAALEALLGPELTAEQAREIYTQGAEAVVFALLALAKRLAEQRTLAAQPHPSTPSGQLPAYAKPPGKKRGKRTGGRNGHPGRTRPTPVHIDRREEHTLAECPTCQGPVTPRGSPRKRLVEDIPADIQPVVTEHRICRYWCERCRKHIEPVVADALPNSRIGLRVAVLSAWLHYLLGTTLSQIIEVFNFHLRFKLSAGGLIHIWHRLADLLEDWYVQIQQQAQDSAVLHADETSWRVNGQTHWLWCFSNRDSTYYLIDRCRGSPAVKKFFLREYAGVLVTDFWGAYQSVVCAGKQKCLAHLLRELKKTEQLSRPGGDWPLFAKKVKRLIGDALRLPKKRNELSAEQFADHRQRLHRRLEQLIQHPWRQTHSQRLAKRLRRYRDELFTFLEHEEVPPDNNHAERILRPAVIVRKNSYANGSEAGAETQSVLMSVFRTLKQRGHNPVAVVYEALHSYLKTGQLPPLPAPLASTS